jgi:hypothetical protein
VILQAKRTFLNKLTENVPFESAFEKNDGLENEKNK